MKLTPEQIQIIIQISLLIIIGLIIKSVIRLLIKTIKRVREIIQNRKKIKSGFKNFKGDTWYPDGSMWNNEKKKWEKPDYKR